MFFNTVVGNKSAVNNTDLNGADNLHITTRALAVTAVTNGLLLFVSTMLFSFLRDKFPRVYSPRFLLHRLDCPIQNFPSHAIGWLFPALKIKDEDILQYLGLDALMFLRYLRLCLKFGLIILPYGLLVALPVNYYGGIWDTDPTMAGLDRLTMGNVTSSSKKLWVHFIGVWVYTLAILYLMYREYVAYQEFRQKSLSNASKYPHRYLVMVCDLPNKLRNQENMKEYVMECFPDQILDVYILEENKEWEKLAAKYEKEQRNLAASKMEYHKKGKRPQHSSKVLLGFTGPKLDSISFHETEKENLRAELEEERAKPRKTLHHAFVAYKSLKAAAIAGNGLAWDYYPDQLQARVCPEKDDIVWSNLRHDSRLRFIVSFVINTVVQFLLILFWAVPIGIASTMVSFRELEETVTIFTNQNPGPVMTGFISGFLSTVVIVLFFALLPYILVFLAYIKGIQTNSEIHNDVLGKLFVFKVVNQFIFYVLGNSMLQRLGYILDNPWDIPNTMAKEMPTASNFFIDFILLRATTVFGFELLRIAPLLIFYIRRKYFVKTNFEDKQAWKPPQMWYSQQYAEILLIFLMTISYSVLAPLVIPFAVLYFGFGYVTWTNQLLFVYVPKWEAHGEMWPIVFHRMMVAIIVFLLFMIGLFGLKKYATIATLILPLLVICIVFWYNVNQMFSKQSANLTFTSCAKIRDLSPDVIEKIFQEYRQSQEIVELGDDTALQGLPMNETVQ